MARAIYRVIHQISFEQHGPPPANFWHKTIARTRLSAEQRRKMLELQDRFHERLYSIRQRAAELPDSLNAFLCTQTATQTPPALASHGSTRSQGSNCEALLCEVLKEEHAAASDFFFGLRSQVLTGLQNAQIFLAAHPYQPDLDAVCTALRSWDNYPDLPVAASAPAHSCVVHEELASLSPAPTVWSTMPLRCQNETRLPQQTYHPTAAASASLRMQPERAHSN
ncbi:hypothetical protein WJX73_006504 [Symbiochloris irregularis]|uniref:Uncharacterized protein n=1 Tax=Symbiochloris irregularis TaxID=706552 RepID=A0AAW1PSD0_9CHLO